MNIFLTGNGSAARRHTKVLEEMGHAVSKKYNGQTYAVIASLTPNHIHDLVGLWQNGFVGDCLVEKPLFLNAEDIDFQFTVYVAYQLRFHPVITKLRELIRGKSVLAAHVYAGQALQYWGGTYHENKANGGGVLRDYSHEFDLLQFLLGEIKDPYGFVGHCNGVDSIYSAVMEAGQTKVTIQLNYEDNQPRREMIFLTDGGSFKVDLIKCTINGEYIADSSLTRIMHEAILEGGKDVCTYQEGLSINRLIDGIEQCG
jgi:predicted dehydrogenase